MRLILIVVLASWGFALQAQTAGPQLISTDLRNFLSYLPKTQKQPDSSVVKLYKSLYLQKSSPAISALRKSEGDSALIAAQLRYKAYWRSFKPDLAKIEARRAEINADFQRFASLFPQKSHPAIHIVAGGFGEPIRLVDGRFIVSAEYFFASPTVNVSELPAELGAQIQAGTFSRQLNTRLMQLYVGSVQKQNQADWQGRVLAAGIREYLSAQLTRKNAVHTSVARCKNDSAELIGRFERDFFKSNDPGWLTTKSAGFKTAECGVFVGYTIAEAFVTRAFDRKSGMQQLLKLDYADFYAVQDVLDKSDVLSNPIDDLRDAYESRRPRVVAITPDVNYSTGVYPGILRMTIRFTATMDMRYAGFAQGPMKSVAATKVSRVVGWDMSGKLLTLELELMPEQQHQLVLDESFVDAEGNSLVPYLIDFKTGMRP
jgi:hypothetical protein